MTIIFWIVVSAMTVLVLGLLLWPLLKRTVAAATGEEEKTLSIFRQQFAELGQDRANGVLTDELYQQARRELERRLLEETGTTETTPKMARRQVSSRPVALALAIIVPTASGLLYWQLGNPLAMTEPPAASLSAQAGGEDGSPFADGLGPLIERLKQKMAQNPNDGTGWALLARSYMGMGRHAEAALAYENATKLIPDDAQLFADYADAMGVLHGRKLEGKPEALIQQALKIDPRNVKALMLAGTVAFNRNNFARAAKDWELARAKSKSGQAMPQSGDLEGTSQPIQSGGEGITVVIDHERMDKESAAPAPTAIQTGQPRAIRGTVTVAPSLAGKASATDTLFVFAREMSGPPMPVAIVRATKGDLPFTFQLDDSTSPMPSRKLSGAGPVVIVARLSKSGQAMPQSGDLEGTSQPIQSGIDGISIVIDRERP